MRAKAGCAAEALKGAVCGCFVMRPSSREGAGTAAGVAPGSRLRRGGLES